jgi:hypothetical protein
MTYSPSDIAPDELDPFMDVLATRLRTLLESDAKGIVSSARIAELSRTSQQGGARQTIIDLLDQTDRIIAGTAKVWPRTDHFGSPPISAGYDDIRATVASDLQACLVDAKAAVQKARELHGDREDVRWLLDGWDRMIEGTQAMWPQAAITIDAVKDWP